MLDRMELEHLARAFIEQADLVDRGHLGPLTELLSRVVAEATERAAKVVRENCAACDGHGWTVERYMRQVGEAPDGEPIGIEDQEQVECEHCGRVISAIRSTLPTPAAQEAQKP